MKKLLFLCLLALTPVSFAKADLKVAVIDLGKAFDSYYKTKEASAHIEEQKATYQKDVQDKMGDYQKMRLRMTQPTPTMMAQNSGRWISG